MTAKKKPAAKKAKKAPAKKKPAAKKAKKAPAKKPASRRNPPVRTHTPIAGDETAKDRRGE